MFFFKDELVGQLNARKYKKVIDWNAVGGAAIVVGIIFLIFS